MENIYEREDAIVGGAQELLASAGRNAIAPEHYAALLDEYCKLLKQTRRMVKMSDMTQSELNRLSRKLEHMSGTDALTDLCNRRFFNELFRKEWDSAVRAGTSLAVLMIDVDFFKKFNDTYGHIMGDSCLQSVAAALREGVKRPRDTIARYGGEEFVVILPETEREGAVHVAGLLIENVRARNIPHLAAPETGIVSVSVGVACARPGPEARPEELLNASDEALYRAKTTGRNRWSE